MPSMADCINRAMDFGEIDRERGMAALDEYQQLFDRYRTIMDDGAAAAKAARDFKEATKVKVAARRHKVLHQLQVMARLKNQIETAPKPGAALRNLLEYSEGSGFTGDSVRSLTEAYEGSINAGLKSVLDQIHLDITGSISNGALLTDLIRELHDEDTGHALAKKLATAVRAQQQRMRRLFNSRGGNIGNLADYGVPHNHDAEILRLKGFVAWSELIADKLDWSRIIDFSTGQPFVTTKGMVPAAQETEAFLKNVYDGIITRGWNDRDPSMVPGGRALYAQRAEARVLHFKDGASWIAYNREFGTHDPFSAMINGLHGLARDVALMSVLGPNPKAGLEYAIQIATQRAELSGNAKMIKNVKSQAILARTMLAHLDGTANRADSVFWAKTLSGTRAVLSSIQLGSAVVSSVTDVATITVAAQTVGMNPQNVLSRSVELMASQATRETAARMGYVAESLADAGGAQSRFMGQVYNTGLPERMSNFTMKATGLAFVTDMRKSAFKMELAGHLADNAARPWAEIDAPLRKMMGDRGITPEEWDLLRDPETHFVARNGANFITGHHWLHAQTKLPQIEAERLAMRLEAAVAEQVEYAIPTVSVEGRARLQGSAPPGSIAGEMLRSAMMYKSYSLSLMLGQYRRFMEAEAWGMNRWAYAVKVSGLLLLTGAMAIQLKELVKGNDPRPMNDNKFWMAALFQGGGLGIFGDFFAAEQSRTGGGLGETAMGPVLGLVDDAAKVVIPNLSAAAYGQETHYGRDAANFLRNNTPFLSSAWYARTAFSRLVADNLQSFLDPEAELSFRRQVKRMQSEYGTQPYIPRRGSGDEIRLPDFGNVFGARK